MNKVTAPRVENMTSPSSGNEVANQFLIYTDNGVVFQSYSTVIATRDLNGNVTLNEDAWEASTTTGKYRNQFLREGIKKTREKIKSGVYTMAKL